MLLALWSGFWNTSDWTPGPTPPPVQRDSGAGSGGYERLGEDYWDARAKMIERHQPIVPRETDTPETVQAIEKYNDIGMQLPVMLQPVNFADIEHLLGTLSLQIQQMRVKSDNEAILALLL